MSDLLRKALLIEGDTALAESMRNMLEEAGGAGFELESFTTLEEGLKHLEKGGCDLVLLSLTLPDSSGLDSYLAVASLYPDHPVVVLAGTENVPLALEAVRKGAQYHLVTDGLTGELLVKTARYAVERGHLLSDLRELTLTDDLTGLYNRRGLSTLAGQQMRVARRQGSRTLLFYFDLDGMKEINDRYGHIEGDIALIETARILRSVFRDSDIIARIGGDEFVVLLLDSMEKDSDILRERLAGKMRERNRISRTPFKLALSAGYTECGPDDILPTLEEMISRADYHMYGEKRARKSLLQFQA